MKDCSRNTWKIKYIKTPKDKLIELMDKFCMTPFKASQAMGITVDTFRKNKSYKSSRNSFNEKNYQDLVDYLREKAKELE